VITGNATEQTKQIGNAVPVNTAKALALAVMERIRNKTIEKEGGV
jgi:site-specific DNA-cytosine methylase